MTMKAEIERIEGDLTSLGVTVKSLCDVAGINQSTWTRWKGGSNIPNMATWGRVKEAFSQIQTEKDAA